MWRFQFTSCDYFGFFVKVTCSLIRYPWLCAQPYPVAKTQLINIFISIEDYPFQISLGTINFL
ncbi:Hypothetical protein PAU_00769 [Photorhabdus asymbiotica]|uniref:Uncharacterized protein n=1 Tax=Photorhabdus asymbiotica subsp. asymbiotica (strain ATCC 43949 / 3105-77) TaxID=553480 RepID=B6VMJ5_PHOAA|nr:Hypothetical protein PAU_00769 [Photorhabdus asymbiotica]CAR67375.1 Hypothetical protein PA-RVA13-1246 [Photorhabdus asymbiotica subsp. asymbiotica ATCC 43949]